MQIKKLTLKEWKELGLPVHRSYIQPLQKPLSNQKLKKFRSLFQSKEVKKVKVIKSIIARKPKDLVKLKQSMGIIFGSNIRKLEKKKGDKNDKTSYRFINL